MRMTRLRGKADLGSGPVLSTLIQLSIPSVAMVLFHTLFHLVDTVFISWLGESHMVAISYTFPVQIGVFAILEGVAFSLKDTFTLFAEMGTPVHKIRLGGGGARSPLWRQIQADVYGHEVETVAAEEGAAYGAAILAAVGAGRWRSVDAACAEVVRVAGVIAPRPEAVARLAEQYQVYRRLYPALRQVFGGQSPMAP